VIISTDSLTKQYGSFKALDDCSLTVERGEVFGLLGPNGAGKTTLLRLLLGYLRPTRGRATIDGLDCHHESVAVRTRVAYLPAEAKLYRPMRGRDVLRFFASLRPGGSLQRSLQLADRLDLDIRRRVAFMSTGMRQKLALAVVLSQETTLLILDEPTASLDPNVRRVVMDLVCETRQQGRTVLLSSHVLSEMEELCDRVAILRQGQLVHTQIMSQLRQRHRIVGCCEGKLPEVPAQLQNRVTVSGDGDRIAIEATGDLAPLLEWLSRLPLREMAVEPSGLRSVYDQFNTSEEVV
jgi:ABC-2 type transport system ATP-binding protein